MFNRRTKRVKSKGIEIFVGMMWLEKFYDYAQRLGYG